MIKDKLQESQELKDGEFISESDNSITNDVIYLKDHVIFWCVQIVFDIIKSRIKNFVIYKKVEFFLVKLNRVSKKNDEILEVKNDLQNHSTN